MNFTREHYQLIYTAVRSHQDKYYYDRQTWTQCNEVIDELHKLVYTQREEQPT
jgi:hypothetical protein